MSGSVEMAAEGASFQSSHREPSYKKREVYEKLMASRKSPLDVPASGPVAMHPAGSGSSNPGPSSQLTPPAASRLSRPSATKRDCTPAASFHLTAPSAVGAAATPTTSLPLPPRSSSLAACKPHPVIFGENIFIECSLLKSNVFLLKEALLNATLADAELHAITDDVRTAREILNEKVTLPLTEIQKKLQDQISREQVSTIHSTTTTTATTQPSPAYGQDYSPTLPLTPTALHPYPSHLYVYPSQDQLLDRRVQLGIPEHQTCVSFSAQPAH